MARKANKTKQFSQADCYGRFALYTNGLAAAFGVIGYLVLGIYYGIIWEGPEYKGMMINGKELNQLLCKQYVRNNLLNFWRIYILSKFMYTGEVSLWMRFPSIISVST